jgi:hypothetical protein
VRTLKVTVGTAIVTPAPTSAIAGIEASVRIWVIIPAVTNTGVCFERAAIVIAATVRRIILVVVILATVTRGLCVLAINTPITGVRGGQPDVTPSPTAKMRLVNSPSTGFASSRDGLLRPLGEILGKRRNHNNCLCFTES